MFQMNKALSNHIWPLTAYDGEGGNDSISEGDDPGGEEEAEEEEEEEKEETEKEANEQSKKGGCTKVDKDVEKKGGGFTKLCSLSPQLQEFTGMPELART